MRLQPVLLVVAVLGICASSASSSLAQNIQVDENGNYFINGVAQAPGALKVEPISGFTTLAYPLSFPVVAGDVFLTESLPASGAPGTGASVVISDVIRFPGNNFMYFFSDRDDPSDPDSLADAAALPSLITPDVGLPEVSLGSGTNGAIYQPGVNPGGNPNSPSLVYEFISDVPEPSSIVLAAAGAGLVLALKRRRRD
jgi:PEP-CTERM motif